MVKNPSAKAGDTRDVDSIPWSGRSPGVGNGNPLQSSCLENSMDRGAWWAKSMRFQRAGHNWVTENTYTYRPSLRFIGQTKEPGSENE